MIMKRKQKKYALAVGMMLMIGGVGSMIYRFVTSPSSAPRKPVSEVVQLKLITPPPLPPPPPPPKIQETKVERLTPTPTPMMKADLTPKPPSNPTPSGPVTTAGPTGAGDSFGLQGGTGGGWGGEGNGDGGAGGSKYGLYELTLKNHIQSELRKRAELRKSNYQVGVELWLRPDGTPDRAVLIGTTGSEQLDRQVEIALSRMARMPQQPPADMPQPVVVQISSS